MSLAVRAASLVTLPEKIRSIQGCLIIFGVRRKITSGGVHEKTGRDVSLYDITARHSRRVCIRPHGHDGEHRGPRMNLMSATKRMPGKADG